MWKTVLFLIFTLLVVPFVAFQFDEWPTGQQQATLTKLVYIYVAVASFCFLLSTITKNYSQVDKLWSILPIVYAWMVYFDSDSEPRILLMAVLVTIWGLRLSYNFARRGGYKLKFWEGDEDYRWAVLMAKPEFNPHWRWVLFNLFFISFYQLGLILLFTLPIVKSMNGTALGIFDFVISALILAAIVVEMIADNQQLKYQTNKYKAKRGEILMNDDYERGFATTGLWGKMRHPNYAAEQSIWIFFYFFSVAATGIWINWSITGCLLLVLLFKGSSDFSEEISKGKYPAYGDYQKKVPRFFPKF